MSQFLNQFSRRKFMMTVGVSAVSSVLLKGCLGNPPDSTTQVQQVTATNISPAQAPETTRVKLGYIPIVESAPLIIAREKGFFAKYGMTNVEVSKQANWGAARDNVEIGSAGGGIDGGQWQMPMPYQISEGRITKGNKKIPMYVLAQLNTHGNGIAIASKWQGQGIDLKLAQGQGIVSQLKSKGNLFKAAHTFPHVNQDFWIRYWLGAGGIDPDRDINLMPVPSAQTVANMKTGTMDAFSTGDPWPYRIVKDKIGYMAALTAEIWKNHPEEYFAMRADWVDKNPKAAKALLMAVMEAQQFASRYKGFTGVDQLPGNFLVPQRCKQLQSGAIDFRHLRRGYFQPVMPFSALLCRPRQQGVTRFERSVDIPLGGEIKLLAHGRLLLCHQSTALSGVHHRV